MKLFPVVTVASLLLTGLVPVEAAVDEGATTKVSLDDSANDKAALEVLDSYKKYSSCVEDQVRAILSKDENAKDVAIQAINNCQPQKASYVDCYVQSSMAADPKTDRVKLRQEASNEADVMQNNVKLLVERKLKRNAADYKP